MVILRPWQPEDRPLLDRFNTPAMTAHQVRAETEEELEKRHARYLRTDFPGQVLVVCDGDDIIGSVAYWEHTDDTDAVVWEAGWSVVPEFQGRGYAGRALEALIGIVRAEGSHSALHAYPAVDNAPSNALCRRAGFVLRGTTPFPFRGGVLLSNDWVLEL